MLTLCVVEMEELTLREVLNELLWHGEIVTDSDGLFDAESEGDGVRLDDSEGLVQVEADAVTLIVGTSEGGTVVSADALTLT